MASIPFNRFNEIGNQVVATWAELYNVSKDVYVGLAQLYCENPDFRKYYEAYHPKMAEFIAEAMRVYAHKNLV